MWNRKKKADSAEERRAAEYVTAEEFCEIFRRDMKPLYTVALLLTASPEKAEQSFVDALDDCRRARVFRNWEQSWSRLAVIESAMRIVKPLQTKGFAYEKENALESDPGVKSGILPIFRLNGFDRFVFVLSVLGRYSVRDCAILLKCAWREVDEARRRAIDFFAEGVRPILATPPMGLSSSIQL